MPSFVLSHPKKTTSLYSSKTSPRKLDHNQFKNPYSSILTNPCSMSSGEYGSNESGWTKYLGSPSQEEGIYDDECNYYYNNHHHRYDLLTPHRGKHNKDSDDNDSVASDASSGPSHHEAFVARNINGGGSSKKEQEQDCYYDARKPSMGEKKVKGKAAPKEPTVLDHKGKKGISSLKQKLQKRGKKAN